MHRRCLLSESLEPRLVLSGLGGSRAAGLEFDSRDTAQQPTDSDEREADGVPAEPTEQDTTASSPSSSTSRPADGSTTTATTTATTTSTYDVPTAFRSVSTSPETDTTGTIADNPELTKPARATAVERRSTTQRAAAGATDTSDTTPTAADVESSLAPIRTDAQTETDDRPIAIADITDVVKDIDDEESDDAVNLVDDAIPLADERLDALASSVGSVSAAPASVFDPRMELAAAPQRPFATTPPSTDRTTEPPEILAAQPNAMTGDGDWISEFLASLFSWLPGDGAGEFDGDAAWTGQMPLLALAGVVTFANAARKGSVDSSKTLAPVADERFEFVGRRWWRDRRPNAAGSRSGRGAARRLPSNAVPSQSPAGDAALAQPELSDAFVMSLMGSVDPDSFLMSPVTAANGSDHDSSDNEGDWSATQELAAASAAIGGTVAAGQAVMKKRGSVSKRPARPSIGFIGTTVVPSSIRS